MHRGALALGVAGSLLALAGCGGSPAAGTTPGALPAESPTSASSDPNPNAPEVNAAGDIPDNQVFVPYTPPGGGFTVAVPQGWAQSSSGPETTFTDKFNSVHLQSQLVPAVPDVGSVKANEVPRLQGSTPGFVLGDATVVHRPAGSAILLTYQATSAPNPVTGKSVTEAVERYEFWRAGRAAVLTLSGPKGADNVDPWRKITDSFRWQ